MKPWFDTAQASHQHSLQTLNLFYEFDDFMASVGTVLDLGCGSGLDMEWWSTRTTRDPKSPRPLNIKCLGVDQAANCTVRHPLVKHRVRDFETLLDLPTEKFDLLWCHDSFHFAKDPFNTLVRWRERTHDNGMLVLVVPQTTNIVNNQQQYESLDGCFYHYTLTNLIYLLAATGWDCKSGYFKKTQDDPWIHAIVYKSAIEPLGTAARWYDLVEADLLPESAVQGINRRGYLSQQDLLLRWLDRSLISYQRY